MQDCIFSALPLVLHQAIDMIFTSRGLNYMADIL